MRSREFTYLSVGMGSWLAALDGQPLAGAVPRMTSLEGNNGSSTKRVLCFRLIGAGTGSDWVYGACRGVYYVPASGSLRVTPRLPLPFADARLDNV